MLESFGVRFGGMLGVVSWCLLALVLVWSSGSSLHSAPLLFYFLKLILGFPSSWRPTASGLWIVIVLPRNNERDAALALSSPFSAFLSLASEQRVSLSRWIRIWSKNVLRGGLGLLDVLAVDELHGRS